MLTYERGTGHAVARSDGHVESVWHHCGSVWWHCVREGA